MKRLIHFLQGIAALTVTGPFPERLINLCAQEGVEFWGVSWENEHILHLTVRRGDLNRLRQLAQRVDCEVNVGTRKGLPDFLLRFRTRYAFLVGMALSLCAVGILSRFVLTVEVIGNERVPTAVILSQLRQLGVRPGVYAPSIDRQQVAQEALLELKDLSWMAINLYGTRLEVLVRETVKEPERIDESGYYDVRAEAGGLVLHVEAEQGDALVQEGDTILEGEILISGTVTMEPPLYSDLPERYYQTHARGRVWARTWRTLTAGIPIQAEKKAYTGEKKSVWSLEFASSRVSLWGKEQPGWEKETQIWSAVLPGGVELPLTLRRDTFSAYHLTQAELNLEAAEQLLEEELEKKLRQMIGEDGQIEALNYTTLQNEAFLQVTLQAECVEEIGMEEQGRTPLPQEELIQEDPG
ncbi:MAG: sporulation protein YqfD [Lawsonibacter sp.]|jgi:similar to stage IV sporulation protein